jgi:8-oxo-dGTP pyrophosphatase MutT (NUDIX family)
VGVPAVIEKAHAYITSGGRLLVFDHVEHPGAGVQVPGGTIDPGESPAAAVVREAREETGLVDFGPATPLGVVDYDARAIGRPEIHRRHFFHLPLRGAAPERWRHYEMFDSGGGGPVEYELYWLPLDEAVRRLSRDHGALLGLLPRGHT